MNTLQLDSSDFLLIRWQIILFLVCVTLTTAVYFTLGYMEDQAVQDLNRANSAFERARSSVELIEDEEATIIENIDEYRELLAGGVMEPEDRLQFLEDLAVIRDELHLFPINLAIASQFKERLAYPQGVSSGGPIDLASSEISLNMALLHEEDFVRFLDAIHSNGGLFQIKDCLLSLRNSGATKFITLQQHMAVECTAIWYSYDLTPPTEQQGLLGGNNGFL
tara:strand:- start:347 stop:1012 length:666 start_codon:yes stop_codon:yes gene_type:complete